MPHHYTKNTVSAHSWCNKCNGQTVHRIDCGRLGPCEKCMANLDEQHNAPKREPKAEQIGLFKANS